MKCKLCQRPVQGKARKTKRFSRCPKKYAIHKPQIVRIFRGDFGRDYMVKHNFIEVGLDPYRIYLPPVTNLNPLMFCAWHCQQSRRHLKWSRVVGSLWQPRFFFAGLCGGLIAYLVAHLSMYHGQCSCPGQCHPDVSVLLGPPSTHPLLQGQTNGRPMSRDAQGYRVLWLPSLFRLRWVFL